MNNIKKIFSYTGLGFMIAVGYMDPGNWATDIGAGSEFGYLLLYIILISGLMAMILQHLSLKLGIVTGKDIAQISQTHYPKLLNLFLWIINEIGIIACDLAEIIGCAIALELLFHIPLLVATLITLLDTFIILFLTSKSFRQLEALVCALVVTIFICFLYNVIVSKPDLGAVMKGFIPSLTIFKNHEALFLAIGILGATVMPHNLYLHSSLVNTRKHDNTPESKKSAIHYATLDSNISLVFALMINAFILILAASSFYTHGKLVTDIKEAYHLLSPLLGVAIASFLFAIALLLSGQNSTITGTLAGQIIMQGFLNLKIKPWQQRFLTRSIAIIPAIVTILIGGEKAVDTLLVFSQVILSLILPFTLIPLVMFTQSKKIMGEFRIKGLIKFLTYITSIIIIVLNVYLVTTFL